MPAAAHDVFMWLEAHRHAWYALPLVIASFIALGLLLLTAAFAYQRLRSEPR